MSFWSWLKRALGVASEPRVLEDVGAVVVDVSHIVVSGASPAGVMAGLQTAQDVGKLVGEIQGDGTVPMPLSAADVARQRAQMASATAHPAAKAQPLVGSTSKGGSNVQQPTADAGHAAISPDPSQGDRTRK
jgi:hypothetical protein